MNLSSSLKYILPIPLLFLILSHKSAIPITPHAALKKEIIISPTLKKEKIISHQNFVTEVIKNNTNTPFFRAPHSEFDLADSELTEDEVKPFLKGHSLPRKINFRSEDTMDSFSANPQTSEHTSSRTLNISSEEFAETIVKERLENSYLHEFAYSHDPKEKLDKLPLNKYDYDLSYFNPGKRDDKKTVISLPGDIFKSIAFQDFTLEYTDDPKRIAEMKSKILSLGHGGEIVLQIKDNGFISDEPGSDFVIYENVFKFSKGKLYQEFAHIGVSETLNESDFVWFPCAPDKYDIKGCAGIVPTERGGDAFDLSEIGVKKAKYIKIIDTGNNHNIGENTEGFDLDAMEIIHGYK